MTRRGLTVSDVERCDGYGTVDYFRSVLANRSPSRRVAPQTARVRWANIVHHVHSSYGNLTRSVNLRNVCIHSYHVH